MNDRPKNHFRRLLPIGLIWGFLTGIFVHFVGSGFAWRSEPPAYWMTFLVIWGGAGVFWAYLTAKFSKRKENNGKDVS